MIDSTLTRPETERVICCGTITERREVRPFVLTLTRNNGTEPKKSVQRVITEKYAVRRKVTCISGFLQSVVNDSSVEPPSALHQKFRLWRILWRGLFTKLMLRHMQIEVSIREALRVAVVRKIPEKTFLILKFAIVKAVRFLEDVEVFVVDDVNMQGLCIE